MPIEIERKFLLATEPDWGHPTLRDAELINFEQIYLKVDGPEQERIRRSQRGNVTAFHYAHLISTGHATREVMEKEIDAEEYARLRTLRDRERHIIIKDRRCFMWRNQFFELDHIHQPASRACHLLELQVERSDQMIELPDFLTFTREATGENAYSNASISQG